MDEEKIKKIKLFHQRVEQLKLNTDFFVHSSFDIDLKVNEASKASFGGIDQKTIKAFLVDFRPFILNDEPINFDFISNLIFIERENFDAEILKNTQEAKDVWAKLLERKESSPVGGLRLNINGKDLLSEKNLQLWMNGEYFHLKAEVRNPLEEIKIAPFEQLSYFVFIDLLQRLSGILFWFDKQVITKVLEKV
jgi:hypothetical protein